MSDIPSAREDLRRALILLRRALSNMTRAKATRRAKTIRHPISEKEKALVIRLSQKHPNMTIHQIANRAGLRNSGRVSEILQGRR